LKHGKHGWVFDILAIAGAITVVAGVTMIFIPVGIVVAGAMLLGFSLWGAKRWQS